MSGENENRSDLNPNTRFEIKVTSVNCLRVHSKVVKIGEYMKKNSRIHFVDIDEKLNVYDDCVIGSFDNVESSEKFVNEILRIAKEEHLTINDLKLSMKIIEKTVEHSNIETGEISLRYSKKNSVGFHFKRF